MMKRGEWKSDEAGRFNLNSAVEIYCES